MKYRQRKKNYKKKYGYNPPSERQRKAAQREVYEAYGLTPKQVEAAVKAFERGFAIFADTLAAAAEAIAAAFRNIASGLRESEDMKP